jgi:hypothetical protein
MPIVALQNFSKRYAVKMLFVVVLIYTSIYHVNILRKIHKRTIPLQLIDTLSVKQALMDSQGCLFVTIQREQWLELKDEYKRQRLKSLDKITHDENGKRFKLYDEKGTLLALSFQRDHKENFLTYMTLRKLN